MQAILRDEVTTTVRFWARSIQMIGDAYNPDERPDTTPIKIEDRSLALVTMIAMRYLHDKVESGDTDLATDPAIHLALTDAMKTLLPDATNPAGAPGRVH